MITITAVKYGYNRYSTFEKNYREQSTLFVFGVKLVVSQQTLDTTELRTNDFLRTDVRCLIAGKQINRRTTHRYVTVTSSLH